MSATTRNVLFNTVALHLLTQGAPALRGMGCAYRGEGGTSCAVGCLITEQVYNRDLEGKNIQPNNDVLRAVQASIKRELGADDLAMLQDLQRAHDDPTFHSISTQARRHVMLGMLRVLAVKHEVTINSMQRLLQLAGLR